MVETDVIVVAGKPVSIPRRVVSRPAVMPRDKIQIPMAVAPTGVVLGTRYTSLTEGVY